METFDRLVREYEAGRLTRRQLIHALGVAAAAAFAPGIAAGQSTRGFHTLSLDHISYQVSDYTRTRDFYADLMGMKVSDDNGTTQCFLHFDDALLIARNRRPRPAEPAEAPPKPLVDHIAYKIDNWNTDTVKAELERRGLTPRLDTNGGPNYVSFHVQDPDGFDLQISGIAKPGDSQYKKP